MSILGHLRLFYLLHLSQPAADRLIYRELRRAKPRRIFEVGIGTGQRSLRLIELAREFHAAGDIHYTGIDLFEDRKADDGPGVPLKTAYRALKATGAKIQLVPGTPHEGFSRIANTMGRADLVILAPRPDVERLGQAWFFIPRLLEPTTLVFLDSPAGEGAGIRLLRTAEIAQFAGAARRHAA